MHLNRSDWPEGQFLLLGLDGVCPSKGLESSTWNTGPIACLKRGVQGAEEEQTGTLGGDQSQAPFLGQMIKGHKQRNIVQLWTCQPRPEQKLDPPSTGHADIQQVARHLVKNYDGDEPGNNLLKMKQRKE